MPSPAGLCPAARLALFLLLLATAAAAWADRITLADGTVVEDWRIERIQTSGDAPVAAIRRLTEGKATSRPEEIPLARIATIEFRDPGDKSPNPEGRVAHLKGEYDDTRHHLVVELMRPTQAGPVFLVRPPLVPPGHRAYVISSDSFSVLDFAPPPVELSPHAVVDSTKPVTAEKKTERSSRRRGRGLRRLLSDSDSPSTRQSPARESYLDDEPVASRPSDPEGAVDEMDILLGNPTGAEPYGEMRDPLELMANPPTGGEQRAPWLLPPAIADPFAAQKAQVAMMAIAVGVIMGMTFFVGTFVLLFSARTVGVTNLGVPKAMGAAALLAVIPPGLFLLAIWFIPVFMALKLGVGIFSWYYSARMIVAGTLEVMESDATKVLIKFYLVLVGLVMLAILYSRHAG